MTAETMGDPIALLELRDFKVDSVADIQKCAKLHAQTAYTLAMMGKKPPFYTIEHWALYLIDKAPDDLHRRLVRLVQAEEKRVGHIWDVRAIIERPFSLMPGLPDGVPAYLTPKMRNLDRLWTEDLFRRKCDHALSHFIQGHGRNAEALRAATRVVQEVYIKMTQGVEGMGLPFTAKLHMKKDGTFELRLEERK